MWASDFEMQQAIVNYPMAKPFRSQDELDEPQTINISNSQRELSICNELHFMWTNLI